MLRLLTTAAALLAIASPALAQAQAAKADANAKKPEPLTIGDRAPDFDITHWLKGEAFDAFEPGRVYVLEFWATWCGPCVASMEHLSQLQQDYKSYQVSIVGISDEPLQTVVDFLFKEYKKNGKLQNDRIQYTLATDPDKSVKDAYFTAAGQRGIPCAFIVGKDGRVEWIGHPMTMDEPLGAVVRDTWDRSAFKEKWDSVQKAEQTMAASREALMKAQADGDYKKVIEILDEAIKLSGGDAGYQVQKFRVLAKNLKDYQQAYALAGEIVNQSWDNAQMLNNVSWFIVDEQGLEKRDLDLALKAAQRATELTEHKDAAILDTLARVHFEKGDLQSAVEYQRQALEHAEGPLLDDVKAALEKYEALAKKGT